MRRYYMGIMLLLITLSSTSYSRVFHDDKPSYNEVPKRLTHVIESQGFTKTGETTFSILFWDLYKSKLLTTSGKYPLSEYGESLIFNINYLADISSEDLIMRTVEQWQHLGINKREYQKYIGQLESLWPDIESGDSLAIFLKNDKSVFYFNDQYIGSINDPEFGQLFIDIWLSEHTSQPELRAELIGGDNHE